MFFYRLPLPRIIQYHIYIKFALKIKKDFTFYVFKSEI